MKKLLKVLLIILASLGIFWGVVNIIPPHKVVEENTWRKTEDVLISAHRGGAELNPENTKMAFDYVIKETSYCDIIEIDVWKTSDDVIVITHDPTLNHVACIPEETPVNIEESTYAELSQYNLGKYFEDRNGNHPYENISLDEAKELGLTIMTLEEFFTEYQKVRDFRIFIEIKTKDDSCKELIDDIEAMVATEEFSWWNDRYMYISFNSGVNKHTLEKYPNRYVAGMGFGMATQLAGAKLCLDPLFRTKYHSIQTSMITKVGPIGINCATKRFVNAAHRRNQTVAYWTINEESDMEHLINIGADIITTDAPDKLAKLIGKI
jgi:glycerophosphoryl diester phosphodiesterase